MIMRKNSIKKLTAQAYDRVMADMYYHLQIVLAAVIANTTRAEQLRLAAYLDAHKGGPVDYSCFAEIGEIARAAGKGHNFDEAVRLSKMADLLVG